MAPYLPVPMVASGAGGYRLLDAHDRPQSIGRLSAHMGQAGVPDLPRAKAEPARTAAGVAEPSAQALLAGAQHVDAEGAVGDKEL